MRRAYLDYFCMTQSRKIFLALFSSVLLIQKESRDCSFRCRRILHFGFTGFWPLDFGSCCSFCFFFWCFWFSGFILFFLFAVSFSISIFFGFVLISLLLRQNFVLFREFLKWDENLPWQSLYCWDLDSLICSLIFDQPRNRRRQLWRPWDLLYPLEFFKFSLWNLWPWLLLSLQQQR